MKLRKILIPAVVVLLCVALGALMMVIGRGHTVYLDNKTIEYNGVEYKAFAHVDATVKGAEKTIKLDARDRGMATWLGQNFHMELTITEKKGDQPRSLAVDLTLPYGMDGPIINLPALLAGLDQEAWLDEFIPAPPSEEPEDVDLSGELGLGGDLTGDMGMEDGVSGGDAIME